MTELMLESATNFKKCIDAISVLIDEAEFTIDKEKLSLKATDPSQISMIDFELPKSAFKEFNIAAPTKIGLDLDYLSQIMARASAKDSLKLTLDEEKSRLKITFKGNSTRSFSVPLVDVSGTEPPSPKIEFDAEIKIRADALQNGLKDAALISSHITVGVDAEEFFIKANSSKGNLKNYTKKGDASLVEMKVKNPASATFPLEYLSDMVKAASSDTEVTVNLKNDAPIEISYKIGEASVKYFLAPRIEQE